MDERKEYEDVVKNTRPFWFVKFTADHYKKIIIAELVCCAIVCFLIYAFGLVHMSELHSEDFMLINEDQP